MINVRLRNESKKLYLNFHKTESLLTESVDLPEQPAHNKSCKALIAYHVRSCDKSKAFILKFDNTFKDHTWKDCKLLLRTPTHKATKLFSHMTTWDHVAN